MIKKNQNHFLQDQILDHLMVAEVIVKEEKKINISIKNIKILKIDQNQDQDQDRGLNQSKNIKMNSGEETI